MMAGHPNSISCPLVVLALFLSTPSWATPINGFLETTAESGWQGNYSVQLTDGTIVSGVNQVNGSFTGISALPLVTTGCVFGPGCGLVTNVSTSTTVTMSSLGLALDGSTSLGSLGPLSWGSQIVRILPGDPSPTVAVLGMTSGLGLTPSNFSFGFNSTLTAFFSSVSGGQTLSALRLDFADGIAPPTSGILREQAPTPDGTPGASIFINNGVPVALGTPLSASTVPEPSSLAFLFVALIGLLLKRVLSVRSIFHPQAVRASRKDNRN
jgi:hypothetical protein